MGSAQLEARFTRPLSPSSAQRKERIMHVSKQLEVIDTGVILRIAREAANGVKVIFGGADGVLIYIDGQGHIHKLPSQGPGDPEIRRAVEAIVQSVQRLEQVSEAGAEKAA
jgi:hypothetical protein